MMQFELTLPSKDGMVIDANLEVGRLKYERARAALGFEVWIRYESSRTICIARVQVANPKDFDWAVSWTHHELESGANFGEFDDFRSDGPAVEIGDTYADAN